MSATPWVAISLQKQRPQLVLTKPSPPAPWRAELRWQAIPRGSLLRTATYPQGVDLDLGALVERQDGAFVVVQSLGSSFGALHAPPYVYLLGDDRYGTSAGGESLWVNMHPHTRCKRLILFAWLYAGAPCFAATGAYVRLVAHDQITRFALLETQPDRPFCALAQLVPPHPWQRLLTYFPSHPALATAYGFGRLPWHDAHHFYKSPWPL